MSTIKDVTLLGTMEARKQAGCLIENHPLVRRIDAMEGYTHLRLFLSESIADISIIALLKDSGLDGIKFG